MELFWFLFLVNLVIMVYPLILGRPFTLLAMLYGFFACFVLLFTFFNMS